MIGWFDGYFTAASAQLNYIAPEKFIIYLRG